MSKVVKGIGRAIGSVVQGVVNGVKSIAKSSIGKIIIGAALVYFGGAALMGAMGSGAAGVAGASGLTGAAQGISAAWTSLGTAGSSLMAGNIGQAVSALGSGIGGSAATLGEAGGLLVNGGAAAGNLAVQGGSAAGIGQAPIAEMLPAGMESAPIAEMGAIEPSALSGAGTQSAGAGAPGSYMQTTYAPGATNSGVINSARNWWNGMSGTEKLVAAQVGTGLVGTGMQAYGANKANNQQLQLAADQRARYNTNNGARLWG